MHHDDVTALQHQLEDLRRENAMLRNLAHRMPGMLYQLLRQPNGEARLVFISHGIRAIFGTEAGQVEENYLLTRKYIYPEDLDLYLLSLSHSYETQQPWNLEYRMLLPQQGLRWMESIATPEPLPDGSVLWHGYIRDITSRKSAEMHSQQLACYDSLTGLPNRELLRHRAGNAVFDATDSGRSGALLFIDLDHFKRINDARGHGAGDALLAQAARRISTLVGPNDTVARTGADEFMILMPDLATNGGEAVRNGIHAAERIREGLAKPYDEGGSPYTITASIGLTLFPRTGSNGLSDLLSEADTALHRAKQAGRNRVAVYEAGMLAEVRERLELEQELPGALAAGQMRLVVQPQVGPAGEEIGGELLLRWRHPSRGVVSPATFIPIAEETGFICELGAWVIEQACQLQLRLAAGGSLLSLSINISPRQFHQESFVEDVRAVLLRTGADPRKLVFEVTESLFIGHWEAETVAERMQALHRLGIRFSIDDFGTGYSNLGYLRHLPLHELKIDQSFVRELPTNPSDGAIVRAIISVAQNLKLQVVAEGVETEEQARFLAASGCHGNQGYFFSEPLPLETWLAPRLSAARHGAPVDRFRTLAG